MPRTVERCPWHTRRTRSLVWLDRHLKFARKPHTLLEQLSLRPLGNVVQRKRFSGRIEMLAWHVMTPIGLRASAGNGAGGLCHVINVRKGASLERRRIGLRLCLRFRRTKPPSALQLSGRPTVAA